MELSSTKLKKLLIFQEGTDKAPKTNKKSARKKFLVSFDVFVIFTVVKHGEIPCDQGSLNKKERQLNLCNILSIFIFKELYLFA